MSHQGDGGWSDAEVQQTTNGRVSTHHAAVDLAEARRAEDVEQQLLLDAGAHPQEELQSRLQEVNAAFGQPLLRVPHRHR